MKKLIALIVLIMIPNLSQTMELEKTTKKIKISPEDNKKYERAALYCACLITWFKQNYYFDEFTTIYYHAEKLTPLEKELFENIFKSDDDFTRKKQIAIYRGIKKNSMIHQEEIFSSLEQIVSLLGYADDQPEDYYLLSRELRSLYSRFFTWPKLIQDDAILRGIHNSQIPGLKRQELLKATQEDQKRLAKLFKTQGYNIEEPNKSTSLLFKSLEEITNKKAAVKIITTFIRKKQKEVTLKITG
jgi:hypothetical protein